MIKTLFKQLRVINTLTGKTQVQKQLPVKASNNNPATKNKAAQYTLDKYFKDAETWDQEIFANIDLSRKRAWLISLFCMGTTLLAIVTLIMLLPLKSFAPYVITVDKSTGYVEVTKGLYEGGITVDQAVTESNLVRYVSSRESYNPSVLRENYNLVSLMSAGTALNEFQRLWDGKNPDNPSVRMGNKAAITIKIKSVSFLNDRTASVRFLRLYYADEQVKTSDWNAVMDFRYINEPAKMEDRFQNPLGFQVTSYRINPEAAEIEKPAVSAPGGETAPPVAPEQDPQPQQQ